MTIVFVPKTLQNRAIRGPPSTSSEAMSRIEDFPVREEVEPDGVSIEVERAQRNFP